MERCHEATPYGTNLTQTERLQCIFCRKCSNADYLLENTVFSRYDRTKNYQKGEDSLFGTADDVLDWGS